MLRLILFFFTILLNVFVAEVRANASLKFVVNDSTKSVTFSVYGASLTMIYVDGGTFTMGATEEQGSEATNEEKPQHKVTLDGYYIGQTEVTQALWKAVMGDNPSYFKGDDNRPIEDVRMNDIITFIGKLNEITGQNFRLPTEAEWEFAARGGNKSKGYKYSGSDNLMDVAWYVYNSNRTTEPVGTKAPNELGLYDMSGNVWEWCQDFWGPYRRSKQKNPQGPTDGYERVIRGGACYKDEMVCRNSFRYYLSPDLRGEFIGFRLVLPELNPKLPTSFTYVPPTVHVPTPKSYRTIVVNGIPFNMVLVDGGSFNMGTKDVPGGNVGYDETPVHQVTLDSFYIGQTEVTQELWLALMDDNPSYHKKGDMKMPVGNVGWNDCQAFIAKLDSLTGIPFRLPTEAEWEFAARGGNESKGYKYAGSDKIEEVAWYKKGADEEDKDDQNYGLHHVATKLPNELGIYDMSGNVCEWCQDFYDKTYYSTSPAYNPQGPSEGSLRVNRGGCWSVIAGGCTVAFRGNSLEDYKTPYDGLRLVFSPQELNDTLPPVATFNDAPTPIESFPLNPTFTVNGVSFAMITVEGGTFLMGTFKQDYYNELGLNWDANHEHEVTLRSYGIGQTEVTQELWQAVMGNNPSRFKDNKQNPVELVSWNDCQKFITKLNEITGQTFRLPTEAEWEFAARGGNKSQGYKFSGSNTLDDVAWYNGNSGIAVHQVATKAPNELGIYDMSGNVYEWCNDWYDEAYYRRSPLKNPKGPSMGSHRVLRGGCYDDYNNCSFFHRWYYFPDEKKYFIGFRLAL